MYANPVNTPPKPGYENVTAISSIVMAASSAVSVFIMLWSKDSNVPAWFIYFPIALGAIGLAFLCAKRVRLLVLASRRNRIARGQFPYLILLVNQFHGFVQNQRTDNIIHVLGNLQNMRDAWRGSGIQNAAFGLLCDVLTRNLIERIKSQGRRFKDFELSSRDLGSLILAYDRLYFVEVMSRLRQQSETIMDQDKREIEAAREAFSGFLDRFDGFCKEVNQSAGANVLEYYFERPKSL